MAEDTEAFWLDTAGSDFSFAAGQYAAFTIQEETKAFTLAASPHHKNFILFATRMRPSPFKEDLRKIPLGTKIKVSPARGRFLLPDSGDKPVVMIAGGIGVTPFHSQVEWVTHEGKSCPITLLYSNRTLALTAFLKDFQEWKKQNPNFKFVPTLTREHPADWPYETGRLDPQKLRKHVPDISQSLYYVVGPPLMVEGVAQTLTGMGIPKIQIKTEKFLGY